MINLILNKLQQSASVPLCLHVYDTENCFITINGIKVDGIRCKIFHFMVRMGKVLTIKNLTRNKKNSLCKNFQLGKVITEKNLKC